MSIVKGLARKRDLSRKDGECFRGYGVMGLPFASGHVLAFRRMTGSSIGPPFTTVWHRDPSGQWTFYVDQDPDRACPRFFGRSLERVAVGEIFLRWDGPMDFSLRIPEARLDWAVRLSSDGVTRAMNAVGRLVPDFIWRNRWALGALGAVASRTLGLGNLALWGRAPNRQRYLSAPKLLWSIEATAAMLEGQDLGPMAPLSAQARLGDFWVPNRGIFAIGEAYFEKLDPAWHSRATTRWTREEFASRNRLDQEASNRDPSAVEELRTR